MLASFTGPSFSVLCHRSIRKNTGGLGGTKKKKEGTKFLFTCMKKNLPDKEQKKEVLRRRLDVLYCMITKLHKEITD